ICHGYTDALYAWFTTRGEPDTFVAPQEKEAGGKNHVDVGMHTPGSAPQSPAPAPSNNGDERRERLRIVELHEVRTINTALADLAKLGFTIEALIPQERTGEEPSRYTLRRGEHETRLDDL